MAKALEVVQANPQPMPGNSDIREFARDLYTHDALNQRLVHLTTGRADAAHGDGGRQ